MQATATARDRSDGRTGAAQSRFCVSDVPETARFDAWRESIGCIFDVEPSHGAAAGRPFHATVDCAAIDNMMVARTRTSGQRWRRSNLTVARNGVDHYMIQTYRQGRQHCEWSNGAVDLANGILVYDLSREMKATSTDMANVSVVVPRTVLGPLLDSPDDVHMRTLDARHPLGAMLRNHLLSLAEQCTTIDEDAARRLAPATAHVIAACLNGAVADDPRQAAAMDRQILDILRRDIEARIDDPGLSPGDLERRHRLSRSRLYRLFEPSGGVVAYIRERRLHAAMARLTNPTFRTRSIGAIAEDLGFSSASDFSRSFVRRFGLSPRAARHYAAQPNRGAPMSGLDRRYESWLRRLGSPGLGETCGQVFGTAC